MSAIAETPHPRGSAAGRAARAFVELTKARLNLLVVVAVAAGFALGGGGAGAALLCCAAGAGLAALGACALNEVLEVGSDRAMARTRGRPLPSGAISVPAAATLAGLLLAGGVVLLGAANGPAPAALAVATALTYALVYTPLKRVTPLALAPGALAGAAPILIGWAAARGAVDQGGLALLALVVAWQLPHVAAIDWVHRADAARGGFRTVAVRDPSGRATGAVAVAGALVLLAVTALVGVEVGASRAATALALAAGLPLVGLAWRLARVPDEARARRLFVASLVHLPLVLGLLVLGR